MFGDNSPWLAHYASKYYDPQKAHEYYEKHKQLKGRTNTRSTSSLNDEGKKIWKVSKESITTEKKGEIKKEKDSRDAKVAQHRESATATRERITAQLKQLSEQLSSKVSSEVDRIRNNSSLSKEKKAIEIAKVRGDAKSERAKNSADVQSQRASVAADLKSVVQATREAYKQAKTSINESYEKIYQAEFDKIASQYASKKSKKKKKQ